MGSTEQPAVTATSDADDRPALVRSTTPPWLWVWVAAYLLPEMPRQITGIRTAIVTYFGPARTSPQPPPGSATVTLLASVFEALVYAMVVAGTLTVVFPWLRGRWVERRFKLVDDDRSVMTEMQQFVDDHDPSIQLRVSLRADQMARIYPMGWRSARIAVFRPLTVLWRRDREAAQAILLHEVAHRRQGDHLIMGLGSPFIWLIRIGAPAYLLLVLIPATIYLAAGGGMASFTAGILEAALIPTAIFLPVTALWLAEFHADQQAAQAIGADGLRQALRAAAGPRVPPAVRAIALLSHPPRRLRLRRAAARPAGAVAFMAAWPAALVVLFLIFVGMDTAGLPWSDGSRLAGLFLKAVVNGLVAEGRPVVIATAVVLLAWPALAAPWERLWSSGPRPRRRQPWWPYLATAGLPVGMLLLSLASSQVSAREFMEVGLTKGPQAACTPITRWALDGGIMRPALASAELTALIQDLRAGDDKRVIAADARRLDAAIRVALAKPPPDPARSSYTQALIGYRTAAREFVRGDIPAGKKAVDDATRSYFTYDKVIVDCMGLRPPPTSPPGPSPTTTPRPGIPG